MELAARRGMNRTVYQPAEDSALLAEAAVSRIEASDCILEVGTGSGYVAERIETETGATVVTSDVNPHAVATARERGLQVVRTDLVAGFQADTFDAVVFNPPYLPTEPETEWSDWMEVALSGGPDGLALIRPFLETVGRVLKADGTIYLLVSSLAGVDAVVELAGERGYSAVVVTEESFPFETLTVLALSR